MAEGGGEVGRNEGLVNGVEGWNARDEENRKEKREGNANARQQHDSATNDTGNETIAVISRRSNCVIRSSLLMMIAFSVHPNHYGNS